MVKHKWGKKGHDEQPIFKLRWFAQIRKLSSGSSASSPPWSAAIIFLLQTLINVTKNHFIWRYSILRKKTNFFEQFKSVKLIRNIAV